MKCAVITPIGPGHASIYEQECLPAIEDAISYSKGPFCSIKIFPVDDTNGGHGRSQSRNRALQQAAVEGIEWVFFQDADDFIAPNAFENFGKVLADFPEVDAVWGLICEQDSTGQPTLREGQREVIQTWEEFLSTPPFKSVQIGAFMKTAKVVPVGFDENMDTGEDFKLYYYMWKHHKCLKLPIIFFINRRGLHSTGPRSATGQDWVRATDDLWQKQLEEVRPFVQINCEGQQSFMQVTNHRDLIQQHYLCGQFFEEQQLLALKGLVKSEAPSIVEVGANIGNHVVFYAKHMNARVIYPVEPNPLALEILDSNIVKNEIASVIDRRGMGFGAGRAVGNASVQFSPTDNLGATSLVADGDGEMGITTLDLLIGDEAVDVLKIDAEGMELDVLAGSVKLIERNRPLIWIEVMRRNQMEFLQNWLQRHNYRIVHSAQALNATDYFVAARG
jgi:FkbM family methyltransferase